MRKGPLVTESTTKRAMKGRRMPPRRKSTSPFSLAPGAGWLFLGSSPERGGTSRSTVPMSGGSGLLLERRLEHVLLSCRHAVQFSHDPAKPHYDNAVCQAEDLLEVR